MAGGRPTKYEDRFCDMIINFFETESHTVVIDKTYYKPGDKQIELHYWTTEDKDEAEQSLNWGTKSEKHEVIANRFPTIERFSHSIGVHRDTLQERAYSKYPEDYEEISLRWELKHPEFSVAYKRATQIQESILVENALQWKYNPQFSMFVAKNRFGRKDKTEVESNTTISADDTIKGLLDNIIK